MLSIDEKSKEVTVRELSTSSRNVSRADSRCLKKGWHDPGPKHQAAVMETISMQHIITHFKALVGGARGVSSKKKADKLPTAVQKAVAAFQKDNGGWGCLKKGTGI